MFPAAGARPKGCRATASCALRHMRARLQGLVETRRSVAPLASPRCHPSTVCVNTEGSYECACPAGEACVNKSGTGLCHDVTSSADCCPVNVLKVRRRCLSTSDQRRYTPWELRRGYSRGGRVEGRKGFPSVEASSLRETHREGGRPGREEPGVLVRRMLSVSPRVVGSMILTKAERRGFSKGLELPKRRHPGVY